MSVFRILRRPFRGGAAYVPILRLQGVIAASGGGGRALNLQGLARPLAKAFADKSAKAVALAINSPGGSPTQSALIGARIRQLSEEAEIPVLAFVEDAAASGGYWLACAADEIHAMETSIVGSIGVVSGGFGFDRLIERWAIDRRLYTAGERKAILDPFKPEKDEDVAILRTLQADIHESFKTWVRERRGARLRGEEETLFSGAFWTAKRAQALGLIDGIGDLRGVLRERFGDKTRFHLINPPKAGLLAQLGGGAAQAGLSALDERALWARIGA